MPSSSPLGRDIEVPGVEVAFADCPSQVQDRWLAIAFLFQHWRVEDLDRLVENGLAIADEYEQYMHELLDRRIDAMVLTRVLAELWESGACRFETSNPGETVFDLSAGPLLGSDEPFTPQTFISFRLRFDHDREVLVGKAFDFTYEIT